MLHRSFALFLAVLVPLLCVCLVIVLAASQLQPPPTGRPERQAAYAGRRAVPIPAPSGPIQDIGLGSCTTGAWYTLCFTGPTYPDEKSKHKDGLDSQLVALIERATRTLDVAVYDFDLANVADAMVAARLRGVAVRMVTDSDSLNDLKNTAKHRAFQKLTRSGIPIVDDQRPDIMHNKFTVVDRTWVSTGSWNYTDGDTYHLNNNMIVIQSPELAANYTAEFEKMFVKHQFGVEKDKGVPHPTVTIGGSRIRSYFAGEDGVAARLVDTIKSARTSLYFLAFSFTHDGIGRAIIDRERAGVTVGGVFETTGSNTPFSEFGKMKSAGVDVYQDGNPWVMHHKVIVIDQTTTIFGSFNFSENADRGNDENVLIIDDAAIARAFKAEYDRVLALAKNPPVRKR